MLHNYKAYKNIEHVSTECEIFFIHLANGTMYTKYKTSRMKRKHFKSTSWIVPKLEKGESGFKFLTYIHVYIYIYITLYIDSAL